MDLSDLCAEARRATKWAWDNDLKRHVPSPIPRRGGVGLISHRSAPLVAGDAPVVAPHVLVCACSGSEMDARCQRPKRGIGPCLRQ